jgi:hypothetical protein
MNVLDQIAFFQNRRDEVPNQELARKLADANDRAGIQEVAENLWNKNAGIQSDCLKVLYEIGYLKPELVAGYAEDFVKLLRSRNNRLVWGGMIALSTIAEIAADTLYPHIDPIRKAMEGGSVITVDNAVLTLAKIAATAPERRGEIFPILLQHLRTCRPKDVPQHSEKTLPAVDAENKKAFVEVLQQRMEDMSPSQAARIKKVIQEANRR